MARDVRDRHARFDGVLPACRGTRCSPNSPTTTPSAPSIVTFRYLVGWIGGVTFTFCTWTFIFPSTAEFAKGQLNPAAYHLFAPILGAFVALAAFLTTHFTRNEVPYLLQPTDAPPPFSLKRVLAEVVLALRNRDFLVLFMTLLTASAIGGTVEALNIYMQTYFWELRRRSAALVCAGDPRLHGRRSR